MHRDALLRVNELRGWAWSDGRRRDTADSAFMVQHRQLVGEHSGVLGFVSLCSAIREPVLGSCPGSNQIVCRTLGNLECFVAR